jgi:hypothetical protein
VKAFVLGKLCIEVVMYAVSYATISSALAIRVAGILRRQAAIALLVAASTAAALLIAYQLGNTLGLPFTLMLEVSLLSVPVGTLLLLTERSMVLRLLGSVTGRLATAHLKG